MNTAFVSLEAARFTVGEEERWVQECSLELTTDYENDESNRRSYWRGFDLELRITDLERDRAFVRELFAADDFRFEGWSPNGAAETATTDYPYTYFAFPFVRVDALNLRERTLELRCDEEIRAGREWILPDEVELGFAVPESETIVRTYCMAKVTSRPLEVALA